MNKTTTAKNKRVRFVIIAIVMAALMLIPIIGLAAGRSNGVEPGLPLSTAAGETRPMGTHMLEWGVFGIALGEFAGIIGMGVSKSRTKRKVAKKEAPSFHAPMAMQREATVAARNPAA